MPRLAFQYASGTAMVEVIPEAGKLNVNSATPQDLERILLSLGADPDRARSVTLAIVQAVPRDPRNPHSRFLRPHLRLFGRPVRPFKS